ncbi:thiamine pyrophosphate-dependent enzyme [Polyangium jinanense]|uniref:Thiamine pyrophosphate-binding protein n=1 Tax=Polyangium jinanense TaxID=2829994 RepID=A0A9X3X3W9_9BACT|nr:thiamine pyrophosphate-dependent enzyme [Polyangium jinanense]MDC3954678.1 thiamine pyrophosphate-binding protein [Polyangium jinanense]MDC3980981.1 thiamine pyrophosphate-binding protein [Polyangium jinanense]
MARPHPDAPLVTTVSDELIEGLRLLGAQFAFGVAGGALVPFYGALMRSSLEVVHCRHESGAVYAAIEASLLTDAPAIAFTTTGPGLTNAITGVVTARWEGAKILLVSGATGGELRGRFALQESNTQTLPGDLYTPSTLFDHAVALEHEAELPRVMRTLARGFARRRGFVAHVAMPLALQAKQAPRVPLTVPAADVAANEAIVTRVLECLREPFALWVGHGARHAAAEVRELVARTGAPVISTPRGKGIVSEEDAHYLGVSGAVGSDPDLVERLKASHVHRTLVLGSRLSEFSTAFLEGLIPPRGLIHIDLDPDVPGSAFPQADTLAVQAEIGGFLRALLARIDARPRRVFPVPRSRPPRLDPRETPARVRPQYLMQCLQDRVIEGSPGVLLAEAGNAFAWTTRYLRFASPHRYRQSGLFCPMGHISAGAIGAALATRKRAVAVVGDGAFLMQNEINTAAKLGAEVTWIVLNDARYGMVDQGLRALGHARPEVDFPEVDFALLARSLGAEGVRVRDETQAFEALDMAMRARGPFVLDVPIDLDEPAPFGDRLRSIDHQTQGISSK